MDLRDILILGGYAYTTSVLVFLYQTLKRTIQNELAHRFKRIEEKIGLEPMDEDEDDDLLP